MLVFIWLIVCLFVYMFIEIYLIYLSNRDLKKYDNYLKERLQINIPTPTEVDLYRKYNRLFANKKEDLKLIILHLTIEKEIKTKDGDFPFVNKIIKLLIPTASIIPFFLSYFNGNFEINAANNVNTILSIIENTKPLLIAVITLLLVMFSLKSLTYHLNLYNEKKRVLINTHLAVIKSVKEES